MRIRQTPHIAVLGGGTGLSSMLRGLKIYSDNITAIVTVTDDGGGSGILRRELNMPPPGDIRNCIQALANAEPAMQAMMNYRFREGTLSGQSLGNLLLAALYDMTPSFDSAVAALSQVLAITGRVLPVTNEGVSLLAYFDDGGVIQGETQITSYKRLTDAVIERVALHPNRPAALPAVLDAIAGAEMIVLGPGSLYTSVIPPLLTDGVADAIRASDAVKVYVMNIMTQDGETENYTAADHAQALLTHGGPGLFQYVLANEGTVPQSLADIYKRQNARPVRLDEARLSGMGLQVETAPIASWEGGLARHDPAALAQALMKLYYERRETKKAD